MASHIGWTVQRGVLWSAELDRLNSHHVAPRIPVDFSPVDSGSFEQLLAIAGQMDRIAPQALARRLDEGRQCYTARVDGSIAAYGWLTRGPEWVSEFERELNVQEGEAYIWDCATLPCHRRQRLFSALAGHVARRLSEEGLHRLWIIAVISAPAMNRRMASAGFEPVMSLTYVRLGERRGLVAIPARGAAAELVSAAQIGRAHV